MLLSLDDLRLKYALRITGVLYIGAHLGDEAKICARHGVTCLRRLFRRL